jgi:hypothetical protein
MGLLAKTNRAATRESVIRWGVGSAIASAILFVAYSFFRPPAIWPLFPLVVLFGGLVGALIEWQLDDFDLGEIVYAAQDHFKVKLPREKVATIERAGDLHKALMAELPDADGEKVWEELKGVLANQLGWDKDEVVKAARFYYELN